MSLNCVSISKHLCVCAVVQISFLDTHICREGQRTILHAWHRIASHFENKKTEGTGFVIAHAFHKKTKAWSNCLTLRKQNRNGRVPCWSSNYSKEQSCSETTSQNWIEQRLSRWSREVVGKDHERLQKTTKNRKRWLATAFAQNPWLFSGSVVNKARFKIKKEKRKNNWGSPSEKTKQRLYVLVRKWKMITGFIWLPTQ